MTIQARWGGLEVHEKILIGSCAVCVYMLVTSPGHYSRDYFTLMRFIVFCSGALAAWHFNRADNLAPAIFLGSTALLFNPFVPLRLLRSTWELIDYGAAIVFMIGGILVWRRK